MSFLLEKGIHIYFFDALSYLKIFNVNNHEFLQKPSKIKWDKDIAVKFENLLQLPNSKLFINNFAKNGIFKEQNCIDSATEFLSSFITNTAETAGLNANQIEFNCSGPFLICSFLPNYQLFNDK